MIMRKLFSITLVAGIGWTSLPTLAQQGELDVIAQQQVVASACPIVWEDIKTAIDTTGVTDPWSGNTADSDAFIAHMTTEMGANAPDGAGLIAMAADVVTVTTECRTQRTRLVDAMLTRIPEQVVLAMKSVTVGLEPEVENNPNSPLVCPTGYVGVPANAAVNVPNVFCVAVYEAKNNGGAKSEATGIAWVSINQANAQAACQAVSEAGFTGSFDLISNPEWMAIARNLDQVAGNWSGGTVGSGTVNRGWSKAPNLASQTDVNCVYGADNSDVCGATGDHLYKRTHSLSTGDEVWDMAGNAAEWVDWSLGGQLTASASTCSNGWTDPGQVASTCSELSAIEVSPSESSWGKAQGLGQVNIKNRGGPPRGGKYNNGDRVGLYSLDLNKYPTDTNAQIGFRCVYRP